MESYPALYIPASDSLTTLPRETPGRFVVGRSTRANLCVPDVAWSREQFAIQIEPDGYYIQQISPKVPTLVNGARAEGRHRLQHGDQIQVSTTLLVFLDRMDPRYRKATPAADPPIDENPELTRKAETDGGCAAAERVTPPGELPLDHDAIIGRDRTSVSLVLDHPRVSRRHAQVSVKGGHVSLRDLGSSNGTFVNGERIDAYRLLKVDDRIDIGPYSFRFTGKSLAQSSREGNLRIVAHNLSRSVRPHAGGSQKIKILDNVTLVVEPREFVCILGASGSGKSTLMHALSAREPADTGRVYLNDVSLYANFQALKQGIAFVPQQDLLHESLTLSQALSYTAQLRLPPDTKADGIQAAVRGALERVDLGTRGGTAIGHLSGGQKKRASLANEIVSRPNLLFLDEVTSGLDEGTDWEMMKLFRRMADGGMTIVCVTHTVANVEDFCHKIVVMANPGVLAFYGTAAEARAYFGVDKLGDVYRVLASRTGEEWRERYQQSDECKRYIHSRIGPPPAGPEAPPVAADQRSWLKHKFPESRRQFGILARRYGNLVLSDRKTLGLAAAQSLLVGILLALVFGTVESAGPKPHFLVFFLGISALWYGCNNAAKEIVKERPIYRLERDVNLSVSSYVLSKMALLSVVGLGQVLLLYMVVAAFSGVPGGSDQLLAMTVTMLAGTATGLLLSAVSKTNDQASTLVPIALIPQILLAGVIVPNLPAFADFLAHTGVSGFWVYRSMASILDKSSHDVALALFVLILHTLICLATSGYILFVRDARGELVYGKAMGRWVKQASKAPVQAAKR